MSRRYLVGNETGRGLLLLAPSLVWIGVFFVLPLCLMLWQSVYQDGWTLDPYRDFFSTDLYLRIILRTLEISVFTTIVSLVLGYPVAYYLVTGRPGVKAIVILFVGIPYMLDYIVRTYAWMILLGRKGVINNVLIQLDVIDGPIRLMPSMLAVLIGMVQVMLPLMILTLYGAMLRVDQRLVDAARIHGASNWNSFRLVFFPLTLPGIYGASLLVFVITMGFYITPALLGGAQETMISQTIAFLGGELLDWPLASAAAAVLLAISLVILVIYNTVFSLDRLWGGAES